MCFLLAKDWVTGNVYPERPQATLPLTSFNPPSPKLYVNINEKCFRYGIRKDESRMSSALSYGQRSNTLHCNESLFHYSSLCCIVDHIRLMAKSRTEDKSVMVSKYHSKLGNCCVYQCFGEMFLVI